MTGTQEQNNLKTKDKTKAFHGIKTYLKIVDSLAKFRRRTVSGDMSDISVWNNSSTSSFLASSDTKVALLKRRVVQLDENKYKLLFLGCGSRQDRGTGNSQRGDESLCVSRIRTGRFVSWFDNMPRLVAIFVKTIKRISTVRIVWTQSFFWLALGHWIVAHVLHNGQEANACSNHSIQVARAKPE